MIIQDKEQMSLLINLSIASARLRNILVHEEHKDFVMRPQIHLLISGNKGSNKSTMLNEVSGHFKTRPYNEITDAGLIGSIEKQTHEFTEGASWTCRNGVMVLDEFEFMHEHGSPKPIINKLLSLTEGEQYYKKKVGLSGKIEPKKDKDLFLRVKDGQIEVKTNFSLIVGTMDKLPFRNIKLDALQSRCIPVTWCPDFPVILDIARGKPIFTYKDLLGDWKSTEKNVEISLKNYEIILNFVISVSDSKELFLRIVGDCCRAYAVLKIHDFIVYNLIAELKTSTTKK